MQTYETDLNAWANEQARLLRAGRFDLLDIEHIAGEIEDVGKSEQRELGEDHQVATQGHQLRPEGVAQPGAQAGGTRLARHGVVARRRPGCYRDGAGLLPGGVSVVGPGRGAGAVVVAGVTAGAFRAERG